MKIEQLEKNKEIKITIGGKNINIKADEFNSEEFTNFLISNANILLTTEEQLEIKEEDCDLTKFFKNIFNSIERDEELDFS